MASPGPLGSVFASLRPCLAQAILANVFLGIGEGAFEAARDYTRRGARPWLTSGVASAAADPYILRHYGELWLGLQGARLLADAAGRALDEAWASGDRLTGEERGRRGERRSGAFTPERPIGRGPWQRAPPDTMTARSRILQ